MIEYSERFVITGQPAGRIYFGSMTKALFSSLFWLCMAAVAVAQTGEFHHGTGGFAVRPPGVDFSQTQLFHVLGPYKLFGTAATWEGDDEVRLNAAFYTVVRGTSQIKPPDKPVILKQWRSVSAEVAKSEKLSLVESPFVFDAFDGVEMHGTGQMQSLTRVFFIKDRLFVLSVLGPGDLTKRSLTMFLDSFRLLTKDERAIAMVDEFAPPLLTQERRAAVDSPDAVDLDLRGHVRRIRDRYQAASPTANELKVQEVHFNEEGFRTKEISFNEGFPDVITTWGWIDGHRVNLQSAVNYPDREGPQASRTAIISGFQPGPFGASRYKDIASLARSFGNKIETELDQLRRPVVRRRYSNNGILVTVERFMYKERVREITTTDSQGGFIAHTREIFDNERNVAERQTLNDRGTAFLTEVFEYEFDQEQNWVVRRTFSKASAKVRRKLIGTARREILYYSLADLRSFG